MIKSMTGYGSAKGSVEGLNITVELKSVNNRYLDASVRLPRSFLFAEELYTTISTNVFFKLETLIYRVVYVIKSENNLVLHILKI